MEVKPIEDGSQNVVAFGKCFTVAEAHHMKAVRAQRSAALCVGCHDIGLVVLTAIELDDEPCFDAGESGDIAADWVLTRSSPLNCAPAYPFAACP